MTDRAFDPINSDPFGQLNPNADKLTYEPGPVIKPITVKPSEDPFASLDTSASKLDYPTDATDTSATGAFARGAARSALPAIGSFPAIGAGATGGAALGTALFPGPGTVVGGLAGGIAGGLGASYAISSAQNWALSKLPDTWREAIGQDDRQQQLDEKEHATASFLGGLLPYALTMRPGAVSKVALPENATALQRIMANPATARVFGGAVMGGLELGQEAIHPEPVNWAHVAIATGFGVVFNKPTRIGESLTELGARPARRVLGEKEPVVGVTEPAPAETAPAEPLEIIRGTANAQVPEGMSPEEAQRLGYTARFRPDLFTPLPAERPVTLADANDLGVMGPGVTQSTFEGGHRRADAASETAAETKRAEQMALGPDTPVDVHRVARTMHPELFAEYEELKSQQRQLSEWESPLAETHLAAVNKELAALEPQIAAAYRRAAEAHGAPIHEEEIEHGLKPSAEPVATTAGQDQTKAPEARAATAAEPGTGRSLVDTRGRGIQYHGSSAPDLKPSSDHYSTLNYYGQGFYTTDAADVAHGYSRRGANVSGERNIYEVKEKHPLRIFNGEAGIPDDIRVALKRDTESHSELDGLLNDVLDQNPKNMRELYDEIREQGTAEGWSADTIQEIFDGINATLRDLGYNGMSHTGGLRTGREPHRVVIYFDPEADLTVRKSNADEFIAEREVAPEPPQAAPPVAGAAGAPPAPGRSIEQQRDFIRGDVEKQLIAAGRPKEEAQAAGALIAARYEARAARFQGKLGTPEELYRAEAAEILGPGMRSEQPRPWKPRAPAQREHISLLQFIAQRGGIKADDPLASDVRSTLGRDNKLIPGFGPLIRKTGIPLDRLREAAVEAGYLPPHSAQEPSTVRSLIDAIHEEEKGRTVYKRGEELAGEKEERESHLHAIEEELNQGLRDVSIDPTVIPDNVRTRAMEIMDREHERDPIKAYEKAESELGLFQKDTAPVFYSAVAKAIDEIPQDKAPASQWLATLKNRPGVKPEEMQWLGLEDWLKGQQGSVSKQAIADYVRANQIEVRDVAKGGEVPPEAVENIRAWLQKEYGKPDENAIVGEDTLKAVLRGDANAIGDLESAGVPDELMKPVYDNIGQGATKFGSYVLPGGENYRELLLQLPHTPRDQVRPSDAASAPYMADWNRLNTEIDVARQDLNAARLEMSPRYAGVMEKVNKLERERDALHNRMVDDTITQSHGRLGGESFRGHFEEPNVLAHIRFDDRTIDGKHTLFVQEFQSDWHKQGRKKGYKEFYKPEELSETPVGTPVASDPARFWYIDAPGQVFQILKSKYPTFKDAVDYIVREKSKGGEIPDAPFKTTWQELALKRIVRYAAEHGYEQVAWTNGETQALRYPNELRKKIDNIAWSTPSAARLALWEKRAPANAQYDEIAAKARSENRQLTPDEIKQREALEKTIKAAGHAAPDMMRYVHAKPVGGGMDMVFTVNPEGKIIEASMAAAKGKNIDEVFGKSMSEKIMAEHDGEIESKDFVLGAKGFQDLYDKQLPQAANKLVKKFGAKVGSAELRKPEGPESKRYTIDTQDSDHYRVIDSETGAVESEHRNYLGAIEHTNELNDRISAPVEAKVHTLDITPDLHAAATEQGFPLFQGARGKIALLEGRRPIITLMKDANASTFIHETGHEWLEQMRRDASHEAAPESVKQDTATIDKWLGIDPNAESIPTKAHEKFARGFEQYLREGVAPSKELASVFARFKQWLMQIYQSLKGLGQPINDDIKQVFDRMLSAEPQRTVIAPERAERPTLSDIHEADATETAPHEADAARDRIYAEKQHYLDNIPEDIRREHESAIQETAKLEAEGFQPGQQEPGGPAVEPAGEARPGGGGRAELVEPGGEPGAEPEGGAGGAEHGAVEPGRDGAEREGASVREPQQRPGGGEESEPLPLAPSPAADFNAAGQSFNVGKDGNIRTENITSVPQLMQAIEESKDRIGGSGKLTMGEMLDTAERLGLQPKDINEERLAAMFGGVTDLAPKIQALRTAIEAQTHTVHGLAKQVRDGGSDMAVAEFVKESARFDMMMSVLSSVTTETGRALGMAFRNLDNLKGSRDLNQLIQDNTGRTLFQHRLTANLAAALDTPAKMSKFLVDSNKRSFGKMILEYWINGLLSGPATHSTNVIGNAILAVQHSLIETPLAAGIGAIRRGLGREGETVHLGEVGARGRALVQSLPAALKAGAESFRASTSVLLPGEEPRALPYQTVTDMVTHPQLNEAVTYQSLMADSFGAVQGLRDGIVAMGELVKAGGVEGAPVIGAQYSLTGAIPDIAVRGVTVLPIGTVARLPGRFLSAADSFQRVLNFAMAKNAMAYRVATEEGRAGTAFASRVAEVRDNPNEAQMTRLVHEASELTLMNKGGKLLQALQHIAGVEADLPGLGPTPLFKFVTPFVHVAGNIIKQSIVQRTALGVLAPEIRADLSGRNGTVAQDMASARMLFGTALAVTLGTLAAQGYASGSGPTDPNEAAMWRLAGNQAHSVRIGDIWYGVQKLGPLGLLMGLSADLYDISKHASEGELTEATASLVHAFSQNVLDQSMMKGPSELLKAIQDSDRYGDAYVRSFVSGFVPMSVGLSQLARTQDPYTRQTRTVIDAIRNKIPGHLDSYFPDGLFPKRDIWGEPMLAPDAIGGPLATGIQIKKMSTDPVNLAMLELDIHPGKVGREIRNVELTDQQYDDYARIAGRMTKMRLDTIVRSADWRNWPNHIKTAVIQETIRQSREAARGMTMMRWPQIVKDATEERRKKFQD